MKLLVPSSARSPDEVSYKFFLLTPDIPHTSKALIKCYKIACRALSEEKTVNRSYKWKGGTEQGIYWLQSTGTVTVGAIISSQPTSSFLRGKPVLFWTGHQGCDAWFLLFAISVVDTLNKTQPVPTSQGKGQSLWEIAHFPYSFFFFFWCQLSWFLFDRTDQEIKENGSFIGYAIRENSVTITN